MTQKEKIGIGVIVGLFIAFGLVLYFTIPRPTGTPNSFESNVLIDQRIKNVEKSR